ncbi:MAG: InlB B-repeat-containing protein [Treponema sp.]|nr:InlB B-repeat-containing protein [Treponema sp.]
MKKNRISKLIIIFTCIFFLVSCGNLFNSMLAEDRVEEKNTVLKISLGKSNSLRTIAPVLYETELTDFTLYKTSVEEENILGFWADQSDLEAESIILSPGEYSFILTAKAKGVLLTGTETLVLKEGENSISFELSVSDYGEEYGSVNITLTYPGNEIANGAILSLVSITDSTQTIDGEVISKSYDEAEDKTTVVFCADKVPAGVYRARTTVTVESAQYISYSDIVKVYSNHTSSGNYESSGFVENGNVYSYHYEEEYKHYFTDYKKYAFMDICDSDLINGDVIKFSINGISLDDVNGIYLIIYSASEEDNYWDALDNCTFSSEIKAGTFFSAEVEYPVTKTFKTTDKSKLYVGFGTMEEETYNPNAKPVAAFVADIRAEVDKTNRDAPVTITYDANGGTCDTTSITRYPGQILPDIKVIGNRSFFDGWYDEKGNKVGTIVAETSTTVKARFNKYRLFEKKVFPDGYVDPPRISREVLEDYSDAYLVAKYDFSKSEKKMVVAFCCSNDEIDLWDRVVYNPGWKSPLSDEEKIVEAYVYAISDLLDFANINVSNWTSIEFDEYGQGAKPSLYLVYPEYASEITDTVNKVNEVKFVTVTFDANGGTVSKSSICREVGQSITDITATKDKKFFDCWVDGNGNKVETVPSESITLTAKWKDNIRYAKDFSNSNKDAVAIPRDVLESYSDSYLVVKTDYSGSGALNKIVRFSWDDTIPEENRDFYASGWHSISDKQKIVDYDVYKISEMLEVANANDPNWNTYFFYDWGGSTLYSHYFDDGKTDNYVLFADIVKPNFAKVTIDGENEYFWPKGYPLGAAVLSDYNYKLYKNSDLTEVYAGEPITDDVTLWSGKCCISFNSNGGSEKKSVKVDQNKWYYLYYLRGGISVYSASEKEDLYSRNDDYNDGGYPNKENCIFAGWYTDEALTTPFAASQEEAVKLSENITLYAKWLDASYTIRFDSNGGSAVEPVRVDGVHYIGCYDYVADWDGIHYFRITLSEVSNGDDLLYWYSYKAPKKEGYEFAGWYTDRECTNEFFSYEPIYAPNSPNGYVRDKIGQLTGDITLYAKWVKLFTITFDTNGGTPLQEYIYSNDKYKDVESITLTNEDSIFIYPEVGSTGITINNGCTYYANPTKTGYSFAGWYTDKALTTPFATSQEEAVKLSENITLYAKWVASRKVTFNANGGTCFFESGEVPDGLWWYSNCEIGKNYFLIMTSFSQDSSSWTSAGGYINNPVKDGKIFTGWYFDEACKNPCPTGSSTAVQITEDLTLYAGWAEPRTITFNANGGSCYLEKVIIPDGFWWYYSITDYSKGYCSINTSASNEGLAWSFMNFTVTDKEKRFAGWYFDEECKKPCPTGSFTAVQITENLTLYAGWE